MNQMLVVEHELPLHSWQFESSLKRCTSAVEKIRKQAGFSLLQRVYQYSLKK